MMPFFIHHFFLGSKLRFGCSLVSTGIPLHTAMEILVTAFVAPKQYALHQTRLQSLL